ncbi:YbeD family protein [Methylobacillus methanolivorans]
MANEPHDDVPSDQETLIEFPCDFPIKVMGEAHEEFANLILNVIQQHLPEFDATRIEMRASTGGKYVSLTCTVLVQSKPQLDDIYRSLTSHPKVKYVL